MNCHTLLVFLTILVCANMSTDRHGSSVAKKLISESYKNNKSRSVCVKQDVEEFNHVIANLYKDLDGHEVAVNSKDVTFRKVSTVEYTDKDGNKAAMNN